MASESKTQNWSKPAAMAIPKGGFFEDKVEQGRYGPIFPKTPACYGFSIVAKVIPGREEAFYEHASPDYAAIDDIGRDVGGDWLIWEEFGHAGSAPALGQGFRRRGFAG